MQRTQNIQDVLDLIDKHRFQTDLVKIEIKGFEENTIFAHASLEASLKLSKKFCVKNIRTKNIENFCEECIKFFTFIHKRTRTVTFEITAYQKRLLMHKKLFELSGSLLEQNISQKKIRK